MLVKKHLCRIKVISFFKAGCHPTAAQTYTSNLGWQCCFVPVSSQLWWCGQIWLWIFQVDFWWASRSYLGGLLLFDFTWTLWSGFIIVASFNKDRRSILFISVSQLLNGLPVLLDQVTYLNISPLGAMNDWSIHLILLTGSSKLSRALKYNWGWWLFSRSDNVELNLTSEVWDVLMQLLFWFTFTTFIV